MTPNRTINSVAPMRICDNGGWTDTWFAEHGRVFSIAVYPYAQVQVPVFTGGEQRGRISIHAENYGESNLHPALVSERHQTVIGITRQFSAAGWKVNRTGGNRGSPLSIAPHPRPPPTRRMYPSSVADSTDNPMLVPST